MTFLFYCWPSLARASAKYLKHYNIKISKISEPAKGNQLSEVAGISNTLEVRFGLFPTSGRPPWKSTCRYLPELALDRTCSVTLSSREPMGRSLYNRLVEIHQKVKPRSHGNFLPSLDQAEKLLQNDSHHPGTALCLLFLSDGKPSDNATGICRGSCKAVAETMCAQGGCRPVWFAKPAMDLIWCVMLPSLARCWPP